MRVLRAFFGVAALMAPGFGLAWPVAAHGADADLPETLIRQGIELRRQGHDDRAFSYLQRAYDVAPTLRSAAQLGLVELALGQWDNAQIHLSEALVPTHDPWVTGNREVLETSRASARSHLGQVRIDGAPADATATTNDGHTTKVPVDGILWLSPGEVTVILSSPDYEPAQGKLTVAVGSTQHWRVQMPRHPTVAGTMPVAASPGSQAAGGAAAPPAGGTEGGSSPRALRNAGIVVSGAGVVAIAAGVIARAQANSQANAIEAAQQKVAQGMPNATYPSNDDNWRTWDRIGVGLLIGGGTVLVGGAVLYLLNRGQASAGAETRATAATGTWSLSVALAPGPGGGNLWLGGAF